MRMPPKPGLDVKKDKGGRLTLEKKSSELRTCFIYKGGPYPSWLAAKDKTIFCGNFGKGGAKPNADAKPAGEQCTPKRKAASHAATPAKDATNYDSHEQGMTANGQSEFRGIALAPAVLDRIAALQEEQMQLETTQFLTTSCFRSMNSGARTSA